MGPAQFNLQYQSPRMAGKFPLRPSLTNGKSSSRRSSIKEVKPRQESKQDVDKVPRPSRKRWHKGLKVFFFALLLMAGGTKAYQFVDSISTEDNQGDTFRDRNTVRLNQRSGRKGVDTYITPYDNRLPKVYPLTNSKLYNIAQSGHNSTWNASITDSSQITDLPKGDLWNLLQTTRQLLQAVSPEVHDMFIQDYENGEIHFTKDLKAQACAAQIRNFKDIDFPPVFWVHGDAQKAGIIAHEYSHKLLKGWPTSWWDYNFNYKKWERQAKLDQNRAYDYQDAILSAMGLPAAGRD